MTRTTVLALGLAAAVSCAAHAQTIVYYDSHGFESPLYQPGPIAGIAPLQDLWTARFTVQNGGPPYPNFDRFTVQSQLVQSGAAAVKFDAAGHTGEQGLRVELRRETMFQVVHPIMKVDVDLYWESSSVLSGSWMLHLQQDVLMPLTSVELFPTGVIKGGLGTLVPPTTLNGSFARDTWNHLTLILNYQTSSIDIRLNGQSIGVVSFPAAGKFYLVGLYLKSRGNDAMYMDNLSILNTQSAGQCYADCNTDGTLTIADFACFQARFAQNDPWADCNQSGGLSIADFGCFQTQFVQGCP